MPGNQKEWQESDMIDFIIMNFKGCVIFRHVDAISKKVFSIFTGRHSNFQIALILYSNICMPICFCFCWAMSWMEYYSLHDSNYIFIDFQDIFSLYNFTDSIRVCLFDHNPRIQWFFLKKFLCI